MARRIPTNFCRNCFDHRLTECSLEGKDQTKGLSRQTVRPLSDQMDSLKECGVIHGQKEVGKKQQKPLCHFPIFLRCFPLCSHFLHILWDLVSDFPTRRTIVQNVFCCFSHSLSHSHTLTLSLSHSPSHTHSLTLSHSLHSLVFFVLFLTSF